MFKQTLVQVLRKGGGGVSFPQSIEMLEVEVFDLPLLFVEIISKALF